MQQMGVSRSGDSYQTTMSKYEQNKEMADLGVGFLDGTIDIKEAAKQLDTINKSKKTIMPVENVSSTKDTKKAKKIAKKEENNSKKTSSSSSKKKDTGLKISNVKNWDKLSKSIQNKLKAQGYS